MTYRKTCHLKVLMIFFANKLCIKHRVHSWKVLVIYHRLKAIDLELQECTTVARTNYFLKPFDSRKNVIIISVIMESTFIFPGQGILCQLDPCCNRDYFFRVITFDVCWYNEFYGILYSIVPSFTGKLTAIHKKTSKARDLQQIGQCNPGENGVCNQEKSSLWPA